jgi:hypothetical protein
VLSIDAKNGAWMLLLVSSTPPNIGRYQIKTICGASDVTLHDSYSIGQFRACIGSTPSNLSDERS